MCPPEFDAVSHDGRAVPPVLIVDDDPAASVATRRALERGGYPSVEEARGDAVLRLARTVFLRLVVSELYVPCAEGPCVVTVLKADRWRLPRLQILVHTRHAMEKDAAWALAAGCDAVVLKPPASGVLLREVRRLDGQRREPAPPRTLR